ncbi:hypothetical protein [Ramlibacter sp. PS4R-6]|uniref:hypothetical protein n=1 Tax=Ramlibacter sp. PS4R-6 TaxID=3133438 RepID=UPI00309AB010
MIRPLALALLAACGLAQAQPAPTRVEASGDAIVFDGRIDPPSAARFVELARDPAIKRVVITSFGGLVGPALDMADAIRDRQLDVEVPKACWSSCANYVFPAGAGKRLGHARAIGWHGNMTHVLWLAQTGREKWDEPLMAQARDLARREAIFYRRVGVDGYVAWFAKIPPYDVESFYALRAADMARFGITGVTVADAAKDDPDAPDIVEVDWQRLAVERPAVTIGP